MKSDNKGISLIEIILVVTMIAILSGGSIAIYNSLGFAKTAKAAKLIDDGMSKIRINTMSKTDREYIYLYNISGTVYMKISTEATPALANLNAATGTKFSKNISLKYKDSSGQHSLATGTNICIYFKRVTGAFESDIEYIELISDNNSSIITCIKETGKHWVD